jgi:hypothetical protein
MTEIRLLAQVDRSLDRGLRVEHTPGRCVAKGEHLL